MDGREGGSVKRADEFNHWKKKERHLFLSFANWLNVTAPSASMPPRPPTPEIYKGEGGKKMGRWREVGLWEGRGGGGGLQTQADRQN